MPMLSALKSAIMKPAVLLCSVIPCSLRSFICRTLIMSMDSRMNPAKALRQLFGLEDFLRWQIDNTAIAYGGGVHPKHRLMDYHSFFVSRITRGATVIDVGCGYGAVSASLAKAGARVTGIDLNKAFISEASMRYGDLDIKFVVGDATKDLPVNKYDAAVLSNVLEHIDNRKGFLSALMKSCNPSVLLIRVPMFTRDWSVPMKKELGIKHFSDPSHFIEYDEKTFREELERVGLRICHSEVKWGEIWAEVRPNA